MLCLVFALWRKHHLQRCVIAQAEVADSRDSREMEGDNFLLRALASGAEAVLRRRDLAARPTRRLADNTETVPAAVRGHLPLTCREKACHPGRRISCGRMGNYQEAASQPLRRDASKARPGQSEQRTPPFSTARTPYIRGDLRKRAMQKKYPPSN